MINSIGIIIVLCNHDIILKQDKKKNLDIVREGHCNVQSLHICYYLVDFGVRLKIQICCMLNYQNSQFCNPNTFIRIVAKFFDIGKLHIQFKVILPRNNSELNQFWQIQVYYCLGNLTFFFQIPNYNSSAKQILREIICSSY